MKLYTFLNKSCYDNCHLQMKPQPTLQFKVCKVMGSLSGVYNALRDAYKCISVFYFFPFFFSSDTPIIPCLFLFTFFYLSFFLLPIVLLYWRAMSSPALYSVVNSRSALRRHLPLRSQTVTFSIQPNSSHTHLSTLQLSQNLYLSLPHLS